MNRNFSNDAKFITVTIDVNLTSVNFADNIKGEHSFENNNFSDFNVNNDIQMLKISFDDNIQIFQSSFKIVNFS